MAVAEGLTSQLWTVAGTVLSPLLFGAGLLRLLRVGPAQGLRLFTAWSWLLGHFALAALTLLWLVLHQPVPGVTLTAGAALTGGALLWWRGLGPARLPRTRAERWLGVATLVLVAIVVDRCLLQNLQPVTFGDEADIWAAKAKVLYGSPGFELGFGLGLYVSHPDYPLWNPLVQVLSFAHAGAVQQYENRLPVQGFAVALLLLLSAAVQRRCSPLIAVLALCAFTATNFLHIGITCYADVMLAFAMLAAVDGWLRWQETGERSWFALACIGLAAALFSKNEGSLLAAAALLALLLARLLRARNATGLQPGRALLWLCVPLFAVLVHRGFNSHFGVSNDLLDPQFGKGQGLFERIVGLFPERAWTVAKFYGGLLIDRGPGPDGEITHLPLGRLLVLSFLVAAVGRGRRLLQGTTGAILLFVVMALTGYMLVFVGTYQWLEWHLRTAADRTVLHVLPVATLGLCMSLGHGRTSATPAA